MLEIHWKSCTLAHMAAADDHQGDPLLQYVERFATILVAAGFPAMPARVFVAFLIAESDRLTAADLAAMLQISPAAVSGAVRYLTGVGLVHKERVPGSRRDYYRMPADVWSEVMRLQSQVLVRWGSMLKEGVGLVGADTPAGVRMADHTAFFEFLTTEIAGVLARWEALENSRLSLLRDAVRGTGPCAGRKTGQTGRSR
jgi:DNA-binding transcriptional regulator GbsR (MarR family)